MTYYHDERHAFFDSKNFEPSMKILNSQSLTIACMVFSAYMHASHRRCHFSCVSASDNQLTASQFEKYAYFSHGKSNVPGWKSKFNFSVQYNKLQITQNNRILHSSSKRSWKQQKNWNGSAFAILWAKTATELHRNNLNKRCVSLNWPYVIWYKDILSYLFQISESQRWNERKTIGTNRVAL